MADFHPETFDETTGYLVQYECPECGESWESQWSCACNDECPSCGLKDVEARDYELDGTHTQEELDAFNGINSSEPDAYVTEELKEAQERAAQLSRGIRLE